MHITSCRNIISIQRSACADFVASFAVKRNEEFTTVYVCVRKITLL